MGIGVGLFLIALGAILKFAVSDPISGIDLGMIGVILMIVGVLGLVLSMLFWSSFSPYRRRRERIIDRDVAPGERRIDRETY
jgi:hypothetical protein